MNLTRVAERHFVVNFATTKVVDGDDKFSVLDFSFNYCSEMHAVQAFHMRSAANNLIPRVLLVRHIQTITMLVSCNQHVAASLLQQRSPEVCTCPLPLREVPFIIGCNVGREEITRVDVLSRVIKWDVTKGDQIRRTCYLWPFQSVL